jgi:hypothetical protein
MSTDALWDFKTRAVEQLCAAFSWYYVTTAIVIAGLCLGANRLARQPHRNGTWEYGWALITLEPIWSKYDPSYFAYWARHEPVISPLFSLAFADAIYFVSTAVLIAIGGCKRWLNSREVLLAVCLLAIPYLIHSFVSR